MMMVEKRFEFNIGTFRILDTQINNELSDIYEVIFMLNSLNDEINRLRFELDTHKHPLWSTRQAEAKVNELVDTISELIEENSELYNEINQLRIENMRLKELRK